MNRILGFLIASMLALFSTCGTAKGGPDLQAQFANPPDSVKPWVYWWWLDSNATKEGITRDLEEMRRQGIGGALVFDAGEGHTTPVGPKFMSPEWLALFKHAVSEADRLGMQLSLNICSGWDAGGTWVTPELAIKKLTWSRTDVKGGAHIEQELPMPPATDGYYRDVAVLAYKVADNVADRSSMATLTDSMDASGRLVWDAPDGNWTVLRFGQTIHGNDYEKKTKSSSRGSQGYEIDFYSRQSLDLHYAETAGKALAEIGPLAGKTLTYLHDDSWECGEPNWTPAMRDEFTKRRGYDPMPYLAIYTGLVVDDPEVSARFQRDIYRTTADLMAENHYGYLHELAAKSGMGIHPESGGPFYANIMDPLMNLGRNDVPMGEFWIRRHEPDGEIPFVDQYPKCDSVKQAATAAHVYGKKLCQAEAFTCMGRNWEEAPYMLKDIADRAFCAGLTRTMLCFYVHQPYMDIKPGYEWPEAGTHFDRNITWWDQMHAFTGYLSRCQLLLRQGLFVADVCYFAGDGAGNFVPGKHFMNPPLPAGYDCDTINGEVLMTRASVRNGRIVLPDGMSYCMLALPQNDAMTPESLGKIAELIDAGATVVGPRPTHSPSLANYPACDQQVKTLADKIWGSCDGQTVKENAHGKGRVVCGKSLEEILGGNGVSRDFEFNRIGGASSSEPAADIDYIHRHVHEDDTDIYYVANLKDQPEAVKCTFRVNNRQPRLWDPVSGKVRDTDGEATADGRVSVDLNLSSRGSVFVVFQGPLVASKSSPQSTPAKTMTISGPWTVKFDPAWGGPASVEFAELVDWTQRQEDGIKYYSGKGTYVKTFQYADAPSGLPVFLDLGECRYVAQARLNGQDLGVAWTKPFRFDISNAVKAGENQIEIDVVNLWPNRLIGDSRLPEEKRLTKTNVQKFYKGEHPLLPSGLLGPVAIINGTPAPK